MKQSPERQRMIDYLIDRAYPVRKAGKFVGERRSGWKIFLEELCEQPDAPLKAMFDSAKDFEEKESALKDL